MNSPTARQWKYWQRQAWRIIERDRRGPHVYRLLSLYHMLRTEKRTHSRAPQIIAKTQALIEEHGGTE